MCESHPETIRNACDTSDVTAVLYIWCMNLKPGTLYFISEHDVLTGKSSNYYKIGLVKASRQGDSLDRADEHQTGNPRELRVHATVDSVAISSLENIMHDLYASQRVLGEWFDLTPVQLKAAIADATAHAAEQKKHVKAFQAAEDLDKETSNGDVLKATAKAKSLFATYAQATANAKQIDVALKATKEMFRSLLSDKVDVSDFALVTPKSGETLDRAALKKAHPEIFDSFMEEVPTFQHTFRMATPSLADVTVPTELQARVTAQLQRVEKATKRPTKALLRAAHLGYLELLSSDGTTDWHVSAAKANLQMLCGRAEGIDGIATWHRGEATKNSFKEEAFRLAHPDLVKAFTKKGTPSFEVLDMRSYK